MCRAKLLIDPEVLSEKVIDSKYQNPHSDYATARNHLYEHDHFLNMIRSAPHVWATEVVFCKECRWRKDGGLCYMISGDGVGVGTGNDFFCQYGERRTE